MIAGMEAQGSGTGSDVGSHCNVVRDLACVDLGDVRLNARVLRMGLAIARCPNAPLTQIFEDPSQLEAAYRLIENERVEPESILAPHRDGTLARCVGHDTILVIHDTTSMAIGGAQPEGMGVLDPGNTSGFYLHMSLAVSLSGEPLGVLRAYAWTRPGKVSGKIPQSVSQYLPDRESLRWIDAVQEVESLLRHGMPDGVPVHAIHVMDREADFIEMLAELFDDGISFVLRGKNDRRLSPGRTATDDKLFAAVKASPVRMETTVQLIRRFQSASQPKQKNPERSGGRERGKITTWSETRTAELEVRSTRRTIFGGNGHHAHFPDAGVPLNVVSVTEANAPENAESVQWHLITDQPIDTVEDIVRAVDIYRKRWLIEEYFKALKTGCKYEDHKFETADRYARMLAIYIPIAVQLLRARWYDRYRPNDPASRLLDADELDALRALLWTKRKTLSPDPTVSEVIKVIARLGGHLPSNGPPGWIILERGFAKLNDFTAGFLAAKAWMTGAPASLDDDDDDDIPEKM
jgi:hypothetical protein